MLLLINIKYDYIARRGLSCEGGSALGQRQGVCGVQGVDAVCGLRSRHQDTSGHTGSIPMCPDVRPYSYLRASAGVTRDACTDGSQVVSSVMPKARPETVSSSVQGTWKVTPGMSTAMSVTI